MAQSHNVLTATVNDIQRLLESGQSSVQLVESYLAQVERHDGYLHAMICTAPKADLLRVAGSLDQERKRGELKGPLHGVPIILKVSSGLSI